MVGRSFWLYVDSLGVRFDDAVDGGVSDPRNSTVFTMFTLLNIGERAGSGLSSIYAVWERQGWPEPKLRESVSPDRTSLFLSMDTADNVREGLAIKTADKQVTRLSAEQRASVIAYLERHGVAKTSEICDLLHIKESRTKELLRAMVSDGLIEGLGANRNRTYRLLNVRVGV